MASWVERLRLLEQRYERTVARFGADHLETLADCRALALTAFAVGDLKTARRYLVDALELSGRLLGTQHPGTVELAGYLAAAGP